MDEPNIPLRLLFWFLVIGGSWKLFGMWRYFIKLQMAKLFGTYKPPAAKRTRTVKEKPVKEQGTEPDRPKAVKKVKQNDNNAVDVPQDCEALLRDCVSALTNLGMQKKAVTMAAQYYINLGERNLEELIRKTLAAAK